MSFATGQSEWLEWCIVVHFPTDPPTSTTIDVHEKGAIPILLSLPQMRNLSFILYMMPEGMRLSCKALNMNNEQIQMSTSKHACVDLARLCGRAKGIPTTFATRSETDIPAVLQPSLGNETDGMDSDTEIYCQPCEDDDEYAFGAKRLVGKQRKYERPHMDPPFVSKKGKKPEELAAGDKAKPFGDPSDPIPVHDEERQTGSADPERESIQFSEKEEASWARWKRQACFTGIPKTTHETSD